MLRNESNDFLSSSLQALDTYLSNGAGYLNVDESTVTNLEYLSHELLGETIQEKQAPLNNELNNEQKKTKTGRKRKSSTENNNPKKAKTSYQRRNIKKVITESKLNENTLRALNEEKERMQRLNMLDTGGGSVSSYPIKFQNEVKSSSVNDVLNEIIQLNKSGGDEFVQNELNKSSDQSICVLDEEGDDHDDEDDGDNDDDHNNDNNVKEEEEDIVTIEDDDVIVFSEKNQSTNRKISNRYEVDVIEDDDDDDCRILSESEHQQEEQACNKKLLRGIHMNDDLNVPNANGQVLVNVNHPIEDEDVFLLPYLARNVKTHQIGGIRFMYDNIVESLTRIRDKTTGFGCILAHAMGLGKTFQVISFIEVFLRCTSAKRVLCIVPINTIQNWLSEFNNWLPENGQQRLDSDTIINYKRPFRVYLINDLTKTNKQRVDIIIDWKNNGGVLLLGYEMFRTLVSGTITSNGKNSKSQKKLSFGNSNLIDLEEEEDNNNKLNDVQEILQTPCLVVCDEGHRIKNNAANIAKSLQTIRTKRRIVLTGYPLQNNLIEYWCMVDFVRPSYLGTKAEFCNMFERPIMNGQCMDSTREDIKLMRHRAHVLHSLLEGFVQRRGHDVFFSSLSKKHEYVILLKLSIIQKQLYLAFMNAIGAMNSNERSNPLRSFAICCKIWNHPDVLYNYHINKESDIDLDLPELQTTAKKTQGKLSHSTSNISLPGSCMVLENSGFNPFAAVDYKSQKSSYDPDWADSLMETYQSNLLQNGAKFVLSFSIIEESILVGDKILLFSQSLLSLDLIERYLQQTNVANTNEKWKKYKNYYRLDGSTSGLERERLINSFNKPNNGIWLFLLSTRAGCLGINLIGANRVIVLDASWNPCHDAQAVCRVYRYGQKKNCFIYRLIADHTMEKKIYDRQISKQTMADRVIDEIQSENHFTRTEVEKLIHFVKEDPPPADLSRLKSNCSDSVLVKSCIKHADVITKEPFTHESLLIEKKEYKLSEREKAMAFKEYQHDKKYFPYTSRSNYSLLQQRYPYTQLIQNHPFNLNYNSQVTSVSSSLSYTQNSLSNSSTSSLTSNSSTSSSASFRQNFNSNSSLYSQILDDKNSNLDFNLNHCLPSSSSMMHNGSNNKPLSYLPFNNNNTEPTNKINDPMLNISNDLKNNEGQNYSETSYRSPNEQQNQQHQQQQQQLGSYQTNGATSTGFNSPSSQYAQNLKDVKISRFTVSNKLIIPTMQNSSDSNQKEELNSSNSIILQPGQTVFLLQTAKGTYLRTTDKKYIAVRGKYAEELIMKGLNIDTNNSLGMINSNNSNLSFNELNSNQFSIEQHQSTFQNQQDSNSVSYLPNMKQENMNFFTSNGIVSGLNNTNNCFSNTNNFSNFSNSNNFNSISDNNYFNETNNSGNLTTLNATDGSTHQEFLYNNLTTK